MKDQKSKIKNLRQPPGASLAFGGRRIRLWRKNYPPASAQIGDVVAESVSGAADQSLK